MTRRKRTNAMTGGGAYRLSHPLVLGVIVARLGAAAIILTYPMQGFLLTLLFDWLDSYVLVHRMGYTRTMYHILDKPLDWAAYATEFVLGVFAGYGVPLLALLAFRSVGQLLFARTHDVRWFVVTPNFYEVAFFWWIAVPAAGWSTGMAPETSLRWFLASCALKIVQEVGLHLLWPRYLPHLRYPRFLRALGYRNTAP